MAVTSKAEDWAVTGLGTKEMAEGSRDCMVAKSTIGTGEWIGNSCKRGMGESAIAPAGYSWARLEPASEDI
jgi:hypothetical protein